MQHSGYGGTKSQMATARVNLWEVLSQAEPKFRINWDMPPSSMVLRDVLAYWEQCRGQRRMPARKDLNPFDIPALLPRVMLVDVLRDPLDFRYRLIGTGVTQRLAYDYTGARFSELAHQKPPSVIYDVANAVLQARRPGLSEVPYMGPDRLTRHATMLLLPLGDVDEVVNMLFFGVDFPSVDQ